MNTVKVKKEELLVSLKDNLSKHIEEVEEAKLARICETKAYFIQLVEKMGSDDKFQPRETIKFPLPDSHEPEYKKAIKMVEMSCEKEITLTSGQFNQLVMDNWEWKNDFLSKTNFYSE